MSVTIAETDSMSSSLNLQLSSALEKKTLIADCVAVSSSVLLDKCSSL